MGRYVEDSNTRKMLRVIRESSLDAGNGEREEIPIPKDERFGETVKALERCVTNQLQNAQVKFEDQSVYFYPKENDIIMTFTILDMNNMIVNFKLNESNGEGCYISCENTQLNDANAKRIQQIKYAYDSWKQNIVQDTNIIDNIKMALMDR